MAAVGEPRANPEVDREGRELDPDFGETKQGEQSEDRSYSHPRNSNCSHPDCTGNCSCYTSSMGSTVDTDYKNRYIRILENQAGKRSKTIADTRIRLKIAVETCMT